MTYENVRDFSAVFGLLILGATYLAAVGWTFRRRANVAHKRAAMMIFDEEQSLPKELGGGQ
ncbi:MAG TPA: cbb3-type cytochrome c oxidase subunit 3 [Sphingopyxis sp.]|nr:cbb3-type cytochrome c oxidase subunit 3 [Sphingopyxis sp.]